MILLNSFRCINLLFYHYLCTILVYWCFVFFVISKNFIFLIIKTKGLRSVAEYSDQPCDITLMLTRQGEVCVSFMAELVPFLQKNIYSKSQVASELFTEKVNCGLERGIDPKLIRVDTVHLISWKTRSVQCKANDNTHTHTRTLTIFAQVTKLIRFIDDIKIRPS